MEVTCLEISNPPAKAVLAIHAGSVRRQAKLEVNTPFIIPHPSSQSGPIEVSLFQQLASQVLPEDNTADALCNIPVSQLDGASSQVQLRIRRGDALAPQDGPKQPPVDSIGVTRDYLEHHQLQQRIQSLIQDVLREQPENPYKYMVEQLRRLQAEKSKMEASPMPKPPDAQADTTPEAAKPLAPRPPAQPKPERTGRNLQSQTKTPEGKTAEKGATNRAQFDSQGMRPLTAAQSAARYSIGLILRGDACLKAAEESLRCGERMKAAKAISSSVLGLTKEKICAQVEEANDSKSLARASVISSLGRASVLLSPQYHRAVTKWAVHLSLRGAAKILNLKKDSSTSQEGRRVSIPTPIVFLESRRESWGQWLSK